MIIEGYDINISQKQMFNWEIRVKTPLGHTFFGSISAGNLNEQMAYEVFKENKKQFILDLSPEDCYVIKEEAQKPTPPEEIKEEIKNEASTNVESPLPETGENKVGHSGDVNQRTGDGTG